MSEAKPRDPIGFPDLEQRIAVHLGMDWGDAAMCEAVSLTPMTDGHVVPFRVTHKRDEGNIIDEWVVFVRRDGSIWWSRAIN